MANDPNRDLLPVKEDCCRTRQGHSERIDHQTLSKLSRSELEDKIHRLLDEQTHLKKLANSQEEKIKRLGTKLLRLINDKKHGGKNSDQPKLAEDLHFQYVELEHENYTLKDKITVLKQQLASHSHHSIVRSPVRSNHTSPLMSMRQSASQFQNEIAFQTTNKNSTAALQLQEAEAHIKLLNNEIKSLHNKIEYLQQDLEKNSLDNRKTKVTENIEFIRLQRSLKQQAIQIAALQAQIKNSENSQKILKEELLKAHNENDEALHLIAAKQNEILHLCSKLEEKNLSRLEEDDLKQRINDLMLERDLLKERADLLMKTIKAKPEEMEKIKELKNLLAQEKIKTKKLEEGLGATTVICYNPKHCFEDSSHENSADLIDYSVPLNEKKDEQCITLINPNTSEKLLRKVTYETLGKRDGWTTPMCKYRPQECKSVQTELINSEFMNVRRDSEIAGDVIERESAEKIKMELEVQHLREMLRSQTSRCEAQQAEINRLMLELKLNEDRCKSTLQKLDRHLSAFENLEMRSRREPSSPSKKTRSPNSQFRTNAPSRSSRTFGEGSQYSDIINEKVSNIPSEMDKLNMRGTSDEDNILENGLGLNRFRSTVLVNAPSNNDMGNTETKKRFVDQVFLESSDEDQPNNAPLREISRHREISGSEELGANPLVKDNLSEGKIYKPNKVKMTHTAKQKSSESGVSEVKLTSEYNFQDKKDINLNAMKGKSESHYGIEDTQKVSISILSLEIDSNSSLWNNDLVKLLFIDFTFLDLHGESTETPDSLPKPSVVGDKCEFNFLTEVEINESRRKVFHSLLNRPDLDLIIFKVVSDSEDFDQLTDFDCEDVGVAVVTMKMFLEKCNKGFFSVPVKNTEDTKEVIGKLTIRIEVTPGLFNSRN